MNIRSWLTLFWLRIAYYFCVIGFVVSSMYTAWFYVDRYILPPMQNQQYGVTFSQRYAQDLGVNWKEAYIAILDDLQVKQVRLPVYWDIIEPVQGEFVFDDYDYMITQAEQRDVQVVLAVGQRVPRWPECHLPHWLDRNETTWVEAQEIIMAQKVVERYRTSGAVMAWQIENEPFLSVFGECAITSPSHLDYIINLVKKLDSSRPIMLTDSGELGDWYRAESRSDIFGISLYRTTHNPYLGYIRYLVPPSLYVAKYAAVNALIPGPTSAKTWIISELQLEPWSPIPIQILDQSTQQTLMNPTVMQDSIHYAQRLPVDTVWVWGVEWWYWQKVLYNNAGPWDFAKTLFR